MAPRIVESDSDEFDELAASDSSSNQQQQQSVAAVSSATKGKGKSSITIPASKSRSSAAAANTRAKKAAPSAGPSRGKRQAAIRANESMDVDNSIASDQDQGEEEEDELADDDDEEEEADGQDDQEDDAEGEEDDNYGDYSMQASTSYSPSGTSVTKIKLKLGGSGNGQSSPVPAPLPSNVVTLKGKGKGKAAARSSPASSAKASKKKGGGKQAAAAPVASKGKRKREEVDEFDENQLDDDDDDDGAGALEDDEEDDEEDFFGNVSDDSNVSMSKMTARQRAAHIGAEPELMQLPQAPSKKKILTQDEVAMRKVETSRRRKHLLNKKLEEEKAETIERLLKKPVGGRRGATTSRLAAQTKVERSNEGSPLLTLPITGGVDENGQVIPPEVLAQQVATKVATSYRWISSIRNGEYKQIWAVPSNLEERFTWPEEGLPKITEVNSEPKQVNYPPPRPPPKTRMLKQAGAVAAA